MSIIVDPTVPPVTENVGNGYIRIQTVAGWLLALLGQPSNAAFTFGTNPFTVNASGDVNITNGSTFTVGGNPILTTKQLYKSSLQSMSGAETALILPVQANERWSAKWILFTNATIGGGGQCTFTLTFPVGTTFTWGEQVSGVVASGTSMAVPFTQALFAFDVTVFVGSNSGNVAFSYAAIVQTPNILAGSTLFANKVTGA